MRLRDAATPTVLIVMAAGAAVYATLLDRNHVSDADREARRRDALPSFHVGDVTRIELVHGPEHTVIERDTLADAGSHGTTWTMTSPRRGAADPGAVDALLRELDLAERLRDVDPTVPTGLDAPRATGTFAMGALTVRLALGAPAPRPEGAAYMSVAGEGTFVVGRALATQLLRGADAYRQRSLLRCGASQIARVDVKGVSSGDVTLERRGPTFRLSGGARAGRSDVEHLFGALADAQAETFLDDDAADRVLAAGAFTVELTPADPAAPHVTLRVGGACPTLEGDVVAVRVSPDRMSACIPRVLSDALGTSAAALTDRSPFFARVDEIEEIRLESEDGAARIDLARKGSGWRERAPEEHDLSHDESESAAALVSSLAGARATEVMPSTGTAAAGRGGRARVTVTRTGSAATEAIVLGPVEADGSTWATRLDDGAKLHLDAATARRFEPHRVALRARDLWGRVVDPASIVAIDDTCGPAGEKLEWRGGAWELRAPSPMAPDPGAVADLTSALARTHVESWITESDDGRFGLHGPGACRVTVTLATPGDAGTSSVDLLFGAATDGGTFGQRSDDPAVFVAPPELRALVTHPVVDRHGFVLDPASLASLSVVHGGTRRTAHLDAVPPDPLVDRAAGLVVLAALHTGGPRAGEGLDSPALELVAAAKVDAGAGAAETRIRVGAPAVVDAQDGYFARCAGVDATFVLRKASVDALLQALTE